MVTDKRDIADIERGIFKRWGVEPESMQVQVESCLGGIYTTYVPAQEEVGNDPIVLFHGFGAGSVFWAPNIQRLSARHSVYTLDLPGFGRSGRPRFEDDETLAELQMVQCIEQWRKTVSINKMFIVAHSFAAFLISSYALEHPCRISHLFLVDPWGFPEKPRLTAKQIDPQVYLHLITRVILYFNPFALLRLSGSYASTLLRSLRPDMRKKLSNGVKEGSDDIYEYITYCNTRYPSGEMVYKSMTNSEGWAKRPMCRRFCGIAPSVPTTFIFGSKSFVDPGPVIDIQTVRDAYVDVQILRGAGHLVNIDAAKDFDNIVLTAIAQTF